MAEEQVVKYIDFCSLPRIVKGARFCFFIELSSCLSCLVNAPQMKQATGAA